MIPYLWLHNIQGQIVDRRRCLLCPIATLLLAHVTYLRDLTTTRSPKCTQCGQCFYTGRRALCLFALFFFWRKFSRNFVVTLTFTRVCIQISGVRGTHRCFRRPRDQGSPHHHGRMRCCCWLGFLGTSSRRGSWEGLTKYVLSREKPNAVGKSLICYSAFSINALDW